MERLIVAWIIAVNGHFECMAMHARERDPEFRLYLFQEADGFKRLANVLAEMLRIHSWLYWRMS